MPKMRILIATRGDRRTQIARALGIHAARPTVEVGAADTREALFKLLADGSWNALLIDRVFAGTDSAELIAAASELLHTTRVDVLTDDDQPGDIAARALASPESAARIAAPEKFDPETGLPAFGTPQQFRDYDGRRPRTGLLSCVSLHAAATPQTAKVITDSLADGGTACRWQGLDIVVIRRAASAGEAFVWAEGVCSRLAAASVGVTWFRAQDFHEAAINQSEHAVRLSLSRGGGVCTWQTVACLEVARRVAASNSDSLAKRDAFLTELSGSLGPVQREQLTTHSEEVAGAAHNLAQLLRLPEAECDLIRLAALFHDIGKVIIPDDLLGKAGPLSPLQRRVMDRHSAEGAYLCDALGLDPEVSRIVRHHHTRFDSGEQAPDAARIVAVADAMITMTSTRPYSPARTFSYALAELRRCRGTIFDPPPVVAAHILGASSMRAAA